MQICLHPSCPIQHKSGQLISWRIPRLQALSLRYSNLSISLDVHHSDEHLHQPFAGECPSDSIQQHWHYGHHQQPQKSLSLLSTSFPNPCGFLSLSPAIVSRLSGVQRLTHHQPSIFHKVLFQHDDEFP